MENNNFFFSFELVSAPLEKVRLHKQFQQNCKVNDETDQQNDCVGFVLEEEPQVCAHADEGDCTRHEGEDGHRAAQNQNLQRGGVVFHQSEQLVHTFALFRSSDIQIEVFFFELVESVETEQANHDGHQQERKGNVEIVQKERFFIVRNDLQ